ncbi:putative F-box/FBD/LRR-repeat protein At5g44950 isoform X1 [Vicia villosa]|uniref:putative F-box/FBD/LRR-repeat protein At5g44950 isoform X1 n=1 Tax=Vicia villosa TaxID=3911 RepID=UPI00273CE2AF|nr:putative F-box/FBD/LRR-repeat protein At5g44950 isoform X1 [Vicia villosa]XP_058782799.1 putative F-box/FBD/LRR-repeat protein At5g44950 isoform X1 [Vicia villosa]XP_058782800.1 putative F-box/FBD/LRR-repeat protein At5g44950 isoform X1 [Vicia villosa]XP_058782801.1 putative F-box/FBD/LRR-repeat protein At5g44950 isoform X1 [Vicia villosa]
MSNSVTKKVSDDVHRDMLSDLPDSVILHILSFLMTKHAIRTCILSSRWKHLWKCLPSLILRRSDFACKEIFMEFMYKVLSLRDSSVSLHTLDFEGISHLLEPHILEWIVNYAISHNVQRLQFNVTSIVEQFPLTLLSSQTLTHLNLTLTHLYYSVCYDCGSLFPKSLNLPALSTLELGNFTFSKGSEPFSTFSKLKNLLISDCHVEGAGTLFISSATLVNFTMHAESDEDNQYKIDLCTPSLCTFAFRGIPYQEISWSNISSLKHVDIDAQLFPYTCSGPPLFLFNWLSEFGNIKSLTVTTNTLQSLTLVPDLLEFKIPFMGKLKFLKVKIEEIEYDLHMMLCDDKLQNVKSEEEAARIQKAFDSGLEPSPLVPDGIVDFLLQNSPSAEVDLVDCRENPFRQRL